MNAFTYEFQEYLKFINVRIGPGDQITTSMRDMAITYRLYYSK